MLKWMRKTSLYILAIPTLFVLLGAASNQAVLIANHDTFPVMLNKATAQKIIAQQSVETPIENGDLVMLDETHCLMTNQTHLNLLADIFDMHNSTESIGDLSLDLGGWLWVFAPFVFGFDVIRKLSKYQA